MSSHTDEEILAAMGRVSLSESAEWSGHIDEHNGRLMAELNRPAIHPDVPVILDWDNGHRYYTNAGDRTQPPGYKTIIAIPEETAREIARRVLHGHCSTPDSFEAAMINVDLDIAYYRRNGPGDSHE